MSSDREGAEAEVNAESRVVETEEVEVEVEAELEMDTDMESWLHETQRNAASHRKMTRDGKWRRK